MAQMVKRLPTMPETQVQFLGRLISLGSLRRREESGTLKEEIGVWSSQGGDKDKLFFPLSPELMIAQ